MGDDLKDEEGRKALEFSVNPRTFPMPPCFDRKRCIGWWVGSKVVEECELVEGPLKLKDLNDSDMRKPIYSIRYFFS